MRASVVVLLLSAASALAAMPAAAQRIVFGRSVEGRPLVAWTVGSDRAARRVLVVGCIHGDECAGLAVTDALRHSHGAHGVQLWVVPEMNPDGAVRDRRGNADGVDLNRNFPASWEPIRDPVYSSGPAPASEPETRAAMALIRRVHPAVTIWYHQHMGLVDESGGDRGVARRYGEIAGLRATCLTFISGEATRWSNQRFIGTTAFVVELPTGSVTRTALAHHLAAVRAIERGARAGSPTRCDAVTPALSSLR